jgi:hypothetical protein
LRGIFGVHAPTNAIGPAACTVRRRRRTQRTPRFQQEAQKIQVLHPVSLRNQKAILSLPQLYRICAELPEHTVLCRFLPFTFYFYSFCAAVPETDAGQSGFRPCLWWDDALRKFGAIQKQLQMPGKSTRKLKIHMAAHGVERLIVPGVPGTM